MDEINAICLDECYSTPKIVVAQKVSEWDELRKLNFPAWQKFTDVFSSKIILEKMIKRNVKNYIFMVRIANNTYELKPEYNFEYDGMTFKISVGSESTSVIVSRENGAIGTTCVKELTRKKLKMIKLRRDVDEIMVRLQHPSSAA